MTTVGARSPSGSGIAGTGAVGIGSFIFTVSVAIGIEFLPDLGAASLPFVEGGILLVTFLGVGTSLAVVGGIESMGPAIAPSIGVGVADFGFASVLLGFVGDLCCLVGFEGFFGCLGIISAHSVSVLEEGNAGC